MRAAALLLLLVRGVSSQECTTGEARLYNNGDTDTNRGIVQVCFNGSWTTVCGGDGWSIHSAIILCKQLGYSEYGTTLNRAYYIKPGIFSGTTDFAYLERLCRGDERVLTDCPLKSSNNCYHTYRRSKDKYHTNYAIVTCQLDNCKEKEIRLVNGTSYREGRVEVCVGGRWGTVCGEGWTEKDAGHMCTRMGYPSTGATIDSYGEGSGLVHNITCPNSPSDCQRTIVTPSKCNHPLDLGVRCQTYLTACETEISKVLSSLTTGPPMECPTVPLTSSTQSRTGTTSNIVTDRETVYMFSLLGLGVFTGLTTVALVTVIMGWIITCVYYQLKMKTKLTKHTPSQPPTQASHIHTDVIYNYIDKTQAPPPVSCDLTTNKAYDSAQCTVCH